MELFADRIQLISIVFSLVVLGFIFWLVKNKKVKEEYSLLWFATALVSLYMSLDRYAVDRLGKNSFRMVEVPAEMRERQTGGSSIFGLYSAYYMIKVLLEILMTALRKPLIKIEQ